MPCKKLLARPKLWVQCPAMIDCRVLKNIVAGLTIFHPGSAPFYRSAIGSVPSGPIRKLSGCPFGGKSLLCGEWVQRWRQYFFPFCFFRLPTKASVLVGFFYPIRRGCPPLRPGGTKGRSPLPRPGLHCWCANIARNMPN